MSRIFGRLVCVAGLVCLTAASAAAQGAAKTALSGTVVDVDGGVVPGANVVAKNDATNVALNTLTNTRGAFAFPVIDPGTYTVTVSRSGFKPALIARAI